MANDLILSEQDRKKLDGIVQQMVSNGEKDEDIQFVVNDFKTKYGQKKSLSVTQTEVPAQSTSGSQTVVTPSSKNGGKAEYGYSWSGGDVGATKISTPTEKEQKQVVSKQPQIKKEVEVGAVEGALNAIERGWKQGIVADMLAVGKTPTKNEIREIARLQKEQQEIKPSLAYEEFNKAETFGDAVKRFVQDPVEITAQLSLESLSALIRHGWKRAAAGAGIGGTMGSVVPAIGTAAGIGTGYIAGIGVAGYNLEVASSILDSLKEAGIDVADEQSLLQGFEDEQKLKAAREYAMKRGIPIAAFDMVTAGLGGKILGKPAKTMLKKIGQAGAEVGVQMAGAGAGEATAQLASKGKISPTQIFAEMIGEVGGGAPDIIVGSIIEKRKGGETAKPEMIKSKLDTQEFNDLVDISEGAGEIDDQTAEQLKKEYQEIQEVNATIPDDKKGNEVVFDLVKERQTLEKQLETTDPAFAPAIEARIEELSSQIQVEAAIPLTAKEKTELNKLQTARDENKSYDKDRLKVLEKRQKAAEKAAQEKLEAEEKAKEETIKRQQEEKAAEEQVGEPTTETVDTKVKPEDAQYDGMFNPDKTGISRIDALMKDDGYNFFYKGVRVEKVMMSPDEYLQRVREGQGTKEDRNVTEEKKKAIIEAIDSGNKINAPFLSTKDGKFNQEGRNRAVVAKERGEKMIPVFIESDVTFDDKVNRGAQLVADAMARGKKTQEEIIADIKNKGLHRDGIYFIENNYEDISAKVKEIQATATAIETPAETVSETVVEQPQSGIETPQQTETTPERVNNFEAALSAKTAPKKDKALKAFGDNQARAKELIDNYDANIEKLKAQGIEPTGTKAEVLADMISGKYDEKLNQPSASKEPTQATEQATEKPIDKKTFAQAIKKVFGLDKNQSDATAEITDAIATAYERMGFGTKDDYYKRFSVQKGGAKSGALYQFIGENANLQQGVRDNLEVARKMEAEGVDGEKIRTATGWFKDNDGKWKFETDDTKLKVNREQLIGQEFGVMPKFYTAEELIGGSEILELYPELKNFRFYIFNDPQYTYSAAYMDGAKAILINLAHDGAKDFGVNLDGKRVSSIRENVSNGVIVHELQHYIQRAEGYRFGGGEKGLGDKYIEASKAQGKTLTQQEIRELLQKAQSDYQRSKIEVEARNAERRSEMTAEQRKQTPPSKTEDVGADEQILFQEGRGAYTNISRTERIIHALSDPNVSTPVHELSNDWFDILLEAQADGHEEAKRMVEAITEFAGTGRAKEYTPKQYERIQETFARGFERYLTTGEAPNAMLKEVFQQFKEWLTDIYNGIKGSEIDIQLNDKMREVYAKMLGEEIKPAAEEGARKTNIGKIKEKVKKTKPKREKPEVLKAEPTSPYEWVLQYFLAGGKIKTSDFKSETGFGVKNERTGRAKAFSEFRRRIWMHSNSSPSMDRLIEQLQEDWRVNFGGEIEYDEARNIIIDVMQSFDTPKQISEELRTAFSVEGRGVIRDRNERIIAKQEEEMAKSYEANQRLLEGVAEEDLEAASEIIDEIDQRLITQEEIEAEAAAFDEYIKSLPEEERNQLLNDTYYENYETTEQIAEGETDVEDKGARQIETKAAREKELAEKRKQLSEVESMRDKLQQALSKLVDRKQAAMFGGKEQALFDDTADVSNQLTKTKKQIEVLRDEVNRLQDLIDQDLEGQQKMELKETYVEKSLSEAKKKNEELEEKIKARLTKKKEPPKDDKGLVKNVIGTQQLADIPNRLIQNWVAEKTRMLEDYVAKTIQKASVSNSAAKRNIADFITSLSRGIMDTREYSQAKRQKLIGEIGQAKLDVEDFHADMWDLIGGDINSADRVHQVLDPEVSQTGLAYDDLTDAEKDLHDLLRDLNDYTHNQNFILGKISQETYDKYKDKYIGRDYVFDDKPDQTIGGRTIKEVLGIYKQRRDLDQVMRDAAVKDPIYLTLKRYLQTAQNKAVADYSDWIFQNHKENNSAGNVVLVSDTPKDGFIKLGKGYGALSDKYVARSVAEDFGSFVFNNEFMSLIYDAFKAYDGLPPRQFMKELLTVGNPQVQIGNFTSNVVFAWLGGVDFPTYISKAPEAIRQIKNKGDVYRLLTKEGLLGSDFISKDLKPMETVIGGEPTTVFGKIRKKLRGTYSGVDDAAKIQMYLSLKDMGYTHDEATIIVFESMQNYQSTGRIWDFASKTPIVGNSFVKFTPEMLRLLKNGITRRPLHTAAFISLLSAAPAIIGKAMGDDDDEIQAAGRMKGIPKLTVPYTDINIPLSWKIGDKRVNLARFLMPMYIYDIGGESRKATEFINKFIPYQLKETETGGVTPFNVQDPFVAPIISIFMNKDFRDKPIVEETDSKFDGTLKRLRYAFRGYGGFYANIIDDIFSTAATGEDFYGRRKTATDVALNTLIKIETFDDARLKEGIKREFQGYERLVDKLYRAYTTKRKKINSEIEEINADKTIDEDRKKKLIALKEQDLMRVSSNILEQVSYVQQDMIKATDYYRNLSRKQSYSEITDAMNEAEETINDRMKKIDGQLNSESGGNFVIDPL